MPHGWKVSGDRNSSHPATDALSQGGLRPDAASASGFTAYVTTGGSDKALKDSINRPIQCHTGPSQLEPSSPDHLTTSHAFAQLWLLGWV